MPVDVLTLTLQWFADPGVWNGPGGIPVRLLQHVLLTVGVVLTASVIALPIGVWFGHGRRGDALTVALVGAARAVPTVGLLTLLGLVIGIGIGAPFITLVVLAALPLLAAASAGVGAVDSDTVDAAYAMGVSTRQVALTVELPLAATVILGGVRSAVLQVIATATLAAYTSDTGLGRYIFTGPKSREYGEMVGGAIVVVVLALVVDALLAAVSRRFTVRRPLRRRRSTDSHPARPHSTPNPRQHSEQPPRRAEDDRLRGSDPGPAAGGDLGASVGQQVDSGEVLEHPHRVGARQHGDGAGQLDASGLAGDRGEDHRR